VRFGPSTTSSEDPNGYWDRLFDEFPEFQFVLYDTDEREVIPEGHTIPCVWDGTPEGLGDGIDAIIATAFPSARSRPGADSALRARGRGQAALPGGRPGESNA
jgi:hypothetical protein